MSDIRSPNHYNDYVNEPIIIPMQLATYNTGAVTIGAPTNMATQLPAANALRTAVGIAYSGTGLALTTPQGQKVRLRVRLSGTITSSGTGQLNFFVTDGTTKSPQNDAVFAVPIAHVNAQATRFSIDLLTEPYANGAVLQFHFVQGSGTAAISNVILEIKSEEHLLGV